MNDNSHMELLIRKFAEGVVSEEELEILQDYLNTPEGLAMLEKIMNEHQLEFGEERMPYLRSALEIPERTHRRIHPAITVAASLVGLIAIIAIYYHYRISEPEEVKYQTSTGQTLDVVLPDNTKVMLNAQSSLSYPKNWLGGSARKVTLKGEAFFRVVHNPQMPFMVYADGVNVKVLGTTFDVKSYVDDTSVETTLVEGRVVVENQDMGQSLAELHPNQKAVYNKGDGKVRLEDASAENETSWTRGVLVFEDRPFGEIIKVLERRYGVKIEVSNETSLQCRFNATIENESLADVLRLFGSNGTMKYEMKGSNSVLIQGTVCGV